MVNFSWKTQPRENVHLTDGMGEKKCSGSLSECAPVTECGGRAVWSTVVG